MKEKKNIILDLDNTLISAEALEDFPFSKSGIKEKCMNFEIWNMDDYYIVFERPHLQKFLDFLFENYNVSVWTAATKDYALFIIDKMILTKPNRKLDWIFFSYHCSISRKKYNTTKHLNLLWNEFQLNFKKNNTLLIDDLKEIYKAQTSNVINIKEFNFLDDSSEKDTELLKIQKYLKENY